MKIARMFGRYLVLPFLLLVVGATAGAWFIVDTGKSFNDDANWFNSPQGIDEAIMVSLGGTDQYVRIRSRDKANPVMLDLHGGPGSPQTGVSYRSLRPLTEYYTLVEWDQRGTPRSPYRSTQGNPNSYDLMVADTVELIEYLQTHLNIERVTLVGHSWGSMLGLGVIKKRPDLIAAYVGVGQALAWNAGFDESKRLLLNAARKTADTETINNLEALQDEWPPKGDVDGFMERIIAIQAPLITYKTSIHASKSNNLFTSDLFSDSLFSPEMGLQDALSMVAGASKATEELMNDLYGRDFRKEFGTTYQVPMFIFQGDHDWQTPTSLVGPWFETLEAPHKEYVAFEHSAHIIINEQPGKYLHQMVTRVRPFSLGQSTTD